MTPEWDAIVVGAGPAGSRTARELARRGFAVALADRNPAVRTDVVCTGIVGAEAFERLELPVEPVVDVVDRARFFAPGGLSVDYEPGRPMAGVVDRTSFDRLLALEAREAGALLLHAHRARSLERREDGVRVLFRTPEGERAVHARALVVATGHRRWLHGASGLGRAPGYVHGVHADLPMEGLDATELRFGTDVAPGFFAWAVPFGDGLARLGLLAPQGGRKLFDRFLRTPAIRERLAFDPDRDEDLVREALRSRGIVQGEVRPSFAERVLAVGEAAGQVKTTTAGGIYYGMLGAEAAAEVLADALGSDRLGTADLALYRELWWARMGDEIEAGLALQAVASRMTDPQIDGLFGALADGLGAAVRTAVRFDWHGPALSVLFRHPSLRSSLGEVLGWKRGRADAPGARGAELLSKAG